MDRESLPTSVKGCTGSAITQKLFGQPWCRRVLLLLLLSTTLLNLASQERSCVKMLGLIPRNLRKACSFLGKATEKSAKKSDPLAASLAKGSASTGLQYILA